MVEKKKYAPAPRMDTYHAHSAYSSETHRAIIPFSALCSGSCVCFTVLMDNRQIKRMYSGSLCVNVLVSRSLWFLQVESALLPWHILLSSLSVTDGLGSVGASLNEWAQMHRVGGQHGRPWPDAPSPKTDAMQDSPSLHGCT